MEIITTTYSTILLEIGGDVFPSVVMNLHLAQTLANFLR